MALRRKIKLSDDDVAEIPMTPMIDIVFQLLIYFLVTIKPIDVMAHLDVYRPSPESQRQRSEVPPNLIKITIFDQGLMINDRLVSLSGLASLLDKLADLDPNQTILIMCTALSPHERLVQVLDMCAQSGLNNLSVISTN
jgi:biopolymer transport protein ExbD